MSKCDVTLHLDQADATYTPGVPITGTVRMTATAPLEYRRVVLLRRWRTEGRGSRDTGGKRTVPLAEAGTLAEGETLELPFAMDAPDEPFTYHGHHLSIEWFIEARVDVPMGRDATAEQAFVLTPGEQAAAAPYMSGGPEVTDAMDVEQARQLGATLSVGCLALFGLPAFLMGVILLVHGIDVLAAEPLEGWGFLAFGVIALGAGGLMLFAALHRHLSESKLEEVDVRLDPWTARPGERVRLHLRIVPRTDIVVEGVRASLRGREEATFRKETLDADGTTGSHWETHKHVVHEAEERIAARPQTVRAGEAATWEAAFTIPEGAPFSFADYNNEVVWTVAPLVEIRRWPDWSTRLQLIVRP